MFGIDFYPTPSSVVEKMISPWRDELKSASILDPSAGKGDILNRLKCLGHNGQRLFAIEIDPNLQSVLKGGNKDLKLIGNDFLMYDGHYHFDFILMNPPFSAGARHLLKAWSVLREGKIACLLNAETIDNPCTAERELLLKIIEDNGGTTEYLGNCFSTAERKTDVEVVLVRLEKKSESSTLHFSGEKMNIPQADDLVTDGLETQLARANFIEALVDTYKAACEAAREYCKAASKYNFYASTFSTLPNRGSNDPSHSYVTTSNYNEMVEELNKRAWHTVFEKTDIKKLLTAKVVQDWHKFQEQQGQLEFNVKNINELFDMLLLNRGELLFQCLEDVFEKMTSFHEDNRVYHEGWKTNDAYMVNKKVIYPNAVTHGQYLPSGSKDKFSMNYNKERFLDDVDKVMCMLSGKRMPENKWVGYKCERTDGIKTILEALKERFAEIGYVGAGDKFDNTAESEFFKLKFWKKGTLHFEFKDENLLQLFNREVANGKGWLMGTEGRSYQSKRKKAA